MKRELKNAGLSRATDASTTDLSANGKNRRRILTALAAAPLVPAMPGLVAAETAIDRILNSSGRDSWDDKFSSAQVMPQKGRQSVAVFAPQTQAYVEQAIRNYEGIVAAGGWPRVPSNEKLRLGVSSENVVALRRRLMISGDMPAKAGLSRNFDTFVDSAVRSFQTRHGLPGDGVMGRYSYAALNISAPI
ncbi:MAG: peptidoglycan-binding protein, partial [Pseudomonadota bacterium]